MAKKLYTFSVQVQVILDDEEDKDWKLPQELSKKAKLYILHSMNDIQENSDYFEDGLYDIIDCPVDTVQFVLE